MNKHVNMAIKIQEHVELKELTTMRVGGNARFFVQISSIPQLVETVMWIRENEVPYFVLGGGSNMLVSDDGFKGIVIKIEIQGLLFEEHEHETHAIISAGEVWSDFVRTVVSRELWGVENLALIPGSVGGAFVQNIGAYGVEVRERVLWVEAFDMSTMSVRRYVNTECCFGYRESIFKSNKNLVVIRGAIKLSHTPHKHIEYEDLKIFFEEQNIHNPTVKEIHDAVVSIRTKKMPQKPLGTAGSFFKNPVISHSQYVLLLEKFPNVKSYVVDDNNVKISAAFLLDKIGGWKGFRRGDVGVHEKQSLILINYGNAKADEIISLATEMKNDIYKKTKINLEEEVVTMKNNF